MLVVKYYVGLSVDGLGRRVYLTRRDYEKDSWSIDQDGCQYTTEDDWEFPPMPSNMDDDYIQRARYTYYEATEVLVKKLKFDPGMFYVSTWGARA